MRGYFGIGVYHPKTTENIGTLWRSAHLFGAAFIFTIGARYQRQPSDTTKAWQSVPLMHFADYDDLVDHLPHGCPITAVEKHDRSRAVDDSCHDPQACYLLGAEDHGLPESILARAHRVVHVETALPISLNVAVAGSIVLHHRYLQGALAHV